MNKRVTHRVIGDVINNKWQSEDKRNAFANAKALKDTVLIVNPKSAGGSTGNNWNRIYNILERVFGKNSAKVVFTKKPGDGTILTRRFLSMGVKNIVAIGGDGTINEVANGFFSYPEHPLSRMHNTIESKGNKNNNTMFFYSSSNPLKPINPSAVMTFLPCGTRNVLTKSLGLPDGVMHCSQVLLDKPIRTKRIDVIRATVTDFNDHSKSVTRLFLNAAEIGIGAKIIDRSKKIRDKINSRIISTTSSIVGTLPFYESNLCEISVDNGREDIITKMTMLVVANGKYLGGGFKAAPHAHMSDGLLDLVVLKDSASFKMLDDLVHIKNGNYINDNDILYMQAKTVSVNLKEGWKDVTVTVDGEPIGVLPAVFELYQKSLCMRI
jgi:diacylglycerol kinase (ATP)